MFSRKLTRSIAVGAAAIAVAGGSYGIVSAAQHFYVTMLGCKMMY